MSLTIREKEHWKERIEARIKAEIEQVKSEDREFFAMVKEESEKRATAELGIEAKFEKRSELEETIRKLRDKVDCLESEMASKLRKSVPDLQYSYYHDDRLISDAISKFRPQLENSLIADHDKGKRILELEREKETLLDTVWLATSSPQIRELWKQVDKLLGAKTSVLQGKLFKSANQK